MTKILLVEDDKSLREIYGVRLLAEGYDIVSAGDGEEALAMAIKEKPELIISDVMMPKISGFDMLDILRSTTETRDIKVIMMTALSSDDQRARGEQLGADKYLVKSQVGIEDVVRTVHEVLGDSGKVVQPAQNSAAAPTSDAPADNASADEPKPEAETATAPETSTNETQENTDMNPTDSTTPPVTPEPVPATDTPVEPATSSPGNDDAGPLPPQPTEVESTLPQPTAPFSSPAPANLGEQVVHPGADEAGAPAPAAEEEVAAPEQINTELTAEPDPVSTQVDTPEPSASAASDPSVVTPPVGESPAPEAPAAPDVAAPAPEEQNPSAPTPPAAPGV